MVRRQMNPLYLHTACVFEKNYRLQDIQLSKSLNGSRRRPQPFSITRFVLAGLGPPPRSRATADNLRLACQSTFAPQRYGGQAVLACQPKLAQRAKVGGEYRARTGDLLVANQALSQLS